MSIPQTYHAVLLIGFIAFGAATQVSAQGNTTSQIPTALPRAIPEDNLAYPVLLILKHGEGSGFFLNTPTTQYLVTANHVIADDETLFDDPATKKTYKPDAELKTVSYSKDMTDTHRNVLIIKLHDLQATGYLHVDLAADVAVMTIATMPAMPTDTLSQFATTVPGAQWVEIATLGTVGASVESIKTLDQVLIGNDVIMFGYPASLGLKQIPQLDPDRPLLRKGIVAGKNLQRRSLVLDCPVYFGNSGGPIFEIDREPLGTRFRLIGVVGQYVPFAESTRTFMLMNNSGYSIAAPMDAVLTLIK
jgi:Trypsin-like peptidase domain